MATTYTVLPQYTLWTSVSPPGSGTISAQGGQYPAGTVGVLGNCYPAYAASGTTRAQSGCHGSIPVPIGFVSWSYCSNAVNTLDPSTPQGNGMSWVVTRGCGIKGVASGFSTATTFPIWQTVRPNVTRSLTTFTCNPKNQ